MRYRPEIDGLRAIAVLPVILFHAGFGAFGGGYVGVDVFFVISGYLITGILIDELERGRFSIARFYERRARRILPALFVVTAACLPFAWAWMSPAQMQDFAGSVAALVVGLSNFYFLSQVDYFAHDAELQPLMHTWSLAVEEQYYLLFPVFLLLLWKLKGRARAWAMLALVLLSLGFAEWGWRQDAGRSFFFTLSRFWEIGAGSLCALLVVRGAPRSANLPAAAGLALIVTAILAYDATTPVPSLYTLAPVVGTALIVLFAGPGTWVARLLSTPPLVGVGLISYSAYLWHQPLFAFARLRSLDEPRPLLMAGLAVLTLVLAWLTWRYVERPFRRRDRPLLTTRRGVFAVSGTVAAAFLAAGVAGHFAGGWPARFDARLLRYAGAADDRARPRCDFSDAGRLPDGLVRNCLREGAPGAATVLLLGDSHAKAISDGLDQALADRGLGYYGLFFNACVPIRGLVRFEDGAGAVEDCTVFLDQALDQAEAAGIGTLVLAARYPLYLTGERFDNREGGTEFGVPTWVDLSGTRDSARLDPARRARVLKAYEDGIRALAARFDVVLVGPIPEAGWDVPDRLFRQALFGQGDGNLSTPRAAYLDRSAEVRALFDRLDAELPGVVVAHAGEAFCDAGSGRCVNADAGGVYYFDDDHLSNTGASRVAPAILGAIEAVRADRGPATGEGNRADAPRGRTPG